MEQPELDFRIISDPGIVHVKKERRQVCRAYSRVPVYTCKSGDKTAEAYAMVSLVELGYAEQSEVHVTLAPLSSEHRSKAVASMCEELNRV